MVVGLLFELRTPQDTAETGRLYQRVCVLLRVTHTARGILH